ncbi:MAG: class I SAM-dependent methyltransferase [Candidatus Woesebacteria bacterium]|nr:MAG: class I SAM-dependent methyltransferase [Candidatus Woesebacteria bacterium]
MSSAYDKYDYQSYWKGREYEHESEVLAIKSFLKKIKKIKKTLEIGGGFGRTTPYYAYRTKKIVFTDPSAKNIKDAKFHLLKKHTLPESKIEFKQSSLENLKKTFRKSKFDLVVMVRVMHHLLSPEKAVATIESLTEDGGYLILEFANKIHFKEVFKNLTKGNFNFLRDQTPIDRRSQKNIKNKTLPFINYHPKTIMNLLKKHNFKILSIYSVSNIRSPFIKKRVPEELLLNLESTLQFPMGKIFFGPSIFILAQKEVKK